MGVLGLGLGLDDYRLVFYCLRDYLDWSFFCCLFIDDGGGHGWVMGLGLDGMNSTLYYYNNFYDSIFNIFFCCCCCALLRRWGRWGFGQRSKEPPGTK